MTEKALERRSATKKRKPLYKRAQSNQYAKLKGESWRRPKGKGNKDRRNRKGHVGMLKVGYGSPKSVKGFNSKGFEEVLVANVLDLEKVDGKTQQAVIKSSVGAKKRIDILKAGQEKKISFANVKDIAKELENLSKKAKESKAKTPEKKVEGKKETKASIASKTKEEKKE